MAAFIFIGVLLAGVLQSGSAAVLQKQSVCVEGETRPADAASRYYWCSDGDWVGKNCPDATVYCPEHLCCSPSNPPPEASSTPASPTTTGPASSEAPSSSPAPSSSQAPSSSEEPSSSSASPSSSEAPSSSPAPSSSQAPSSSEEPSSSSASPSSEEPSSEPPTSSETPSSEPSTSSDPDTTTTPVPPTPSCNDGEKRPIVGDCKHYRLCEKGDFITEKCGWLHHFDSRSLECNIFKYKCA